MEKFQNKLEGMECKCSSFNTQGTESPLSDSGWENFSFPLSYQFPWEEIEMQIMEGSFFLELEVISGRVWCSVYKSLTGWLLARGHVGWMDVWRRNEGSAEEEKREEGKAGQTLKFPPPLEKLIRLVCLTLRRSRGAKLAELPFSKLLQDEDGGRAGRSLRCRGARCSHKLIAGSKSNL